MSDFIELCKRRQTCRGFADRPVEHEKLAQCIEAARLAPSGCNAQPWSFVVVESPDKVAAVAQCAMQLGANPYIAGTKAFVVVLEEHAKLMPAIAKVVDSQYFAKGDLGAAIAYLCLESEEQGLGNCQVGIFDRDGIREIAGIPMDKPIAALIALGYPADTAVRGKARKPIAEVVRYI